jgi:hypothetical protein
MAFRLSNTRGVSLNVNAHAHLTLCSLGNSGMSPIEDRAVQDRATDTGRVPLVVDLASRLKVADTTHRRRHKSASSPSRMYLFPAANTRVMPPSHNVRLMRPTPAMRLHIVDSPAHISAGASATRRRISGGLPGWIRTLTTRRALMLGAIACYALIMFNLIYGIATLARLKSLRPLPPVAATEPQRPMAAVADAILPSSTLNNLSPLAGAGVPGPCTFDAAFEANWEGRRHARTC